MNIVIRPFTLDDRPGLIASIDAVCGEVRWMSTSHFEPTLAWTHALVHPDCLCHSLLVVEVNQNIVGWCRMFPTQCNGTMQVELGIGLLAPYRLRGLGTKLVRQSLEWARQTGYDMASLQVHPANAIARHVFERCGFCYDGTADGQLTMTRRLRIQE